MAIRQIIGYVPQQLSIDSSLTGWENVWLFARLFAVLLVALIAGITAAAALLGRLARG